MCPKRTCVRESRTPVGRLQGLGRHKAIDDDFGRPIRRRSRLANAHCQRVIEPHIALVVSQVVVVAQDTAVRLVGRYVTNTADFEQDDGSVMRLDYTAKVR
jgi:hypothetical protein